MNPDDSLCKSSPQLKLELPCHSQIPSPRSPPPLANWNSSFILSHLHPRDSLPFPHCHRHGLTWCVLVCVFLFSIYSFYIFVFMSGVLGFNFWDSPTLAHDSGSVFLSAEGCQPVWSDCKLFINLLWHATSWTTHRLTGWVQLRAPRWCQDFAWTCFHFLNYIYLLSIVYVSVCESVCMSIHGPAHTHIPQHVCGDQRTICFLLPQCGLQEQTLVPSKHIDGLPSNPSHQSYVSIYCLYTLGCRAMRLYKHKGD